MQQLAQNSYDYEVINLRMKKKNKETEIAYKMCKRVRLNI